MRKTNYCKYASFDRIFEDWRYSIAIDVQQELFMSLKSRVSCTAIRAMGKAEVWTMAGRKKCSDYGCEFTVRA